MPTPYCAPVFLFTILIRASRGRPEISNSRPGLTSELRSLRFEVVLAGLARSPALGFQGFRTSRATVDSKESVKQFWHFTFCIFVGLRPKHTDVLFPQGFPRGPPLCHRRGWRASHDTLALGDMLSSWNSQISSQALRSQTQPG